MGEIPATVIAEPNIASTQTTLRPSLDRPVSQLPLLPFPYRDLLPGESLVIDREFGYAQLRCDDVTKPGEIYTMQSMGNLLRATVEAKNSTTDQTQKDSLNDTIGRCAWALALFDERGLAEKIAKDPEYFYTRFYPSETS